MKFHSEAVRDKRTRFYLPVQKILRSCEVKNPEILVGNREYQTSIHYLNTMMEMLPGGSVLLDFGCAIHGGIRINEFCRSGALEISLGESVSECINMPNQDCSTKRDIVTLPNCGMYEFGNTVFRFAKVRNLSDHPLVIQNIMAVALERDLEVTGSFESSDERLNRIWKTAIRTVHLCMQDYLYDGAKRDRIIWMGDMHPEMKGILCAFSDTDIIRDSFEFLMKQAGPDKPMNGRYYSYNCWFIISMWEYYLATGDKAFLIKHADYIQKMLALFSTFVSADGSECIPETRFLDWPNHDNEQAKHAGLQALLFWMMRDGEKLLAELNSDCQAVAAAQKLLKTHLPDPAGRKAPAALLTLTGLHDRSDVLAENPFNDVSTFYGYYVLQAKPTADALALIRQYWGGMLDMGATSFWEDFDLDWTKNSCRLDEFPCPGRRDIHADFGKYCYKGLRHSLSHGWSCGPAPFMSERVLGIKFLTPGGKVISVKPDLGDLEYVKGSIPIPGGKITVEADRSGKFKVDAPTGTEIITA